jgi:tetratricopeptide (TPR) repeat protein
MAKNQKNIKKAPAPVAIKPISKDVDFISVKLALILLVAFTFITLVPSLRNGFVFWDDPQYVTENPYMGASLHTFFTTYWLSNYHPLTMMGYSAIHHFAGNNPLAYHFTDLVIHILNTVLVFYIIYNLLQQKNIVIAFVTALLFGIHPMHVESVTWISELKDVLYTFFFLSALLSYVVYVQNKLQLKYLAAALGLFVISLLAKGQAVTLPVCFLLVDYFIGRKWSLRIITEKVLFFALSVTFGIVAIKAQGTAINQDYTHSFQNLFWGFYGLSMYIVKSVFPFRLSGIYPYPYTGVRDIPLIAYISPLLIIGIAALAYIKWRKNKFVIFGLLFFLGNIVTVLKFIPVGDAIIADRYSYIPYIGLFFIAGYLCSLLLKNEKIKKTNLYVAGAVLLVGISSLSFARTMVWKDSYSFWGDVIKKQPNYWRAYYCIGEEYYNIGKYDSAMVYFTKATVSDKLCPPDPYMWRGVTELEKLNNIDGAIVDFQKVIDFPNKSDPSQIDGRLNLGLAYFRKGQTEPAIKLYNEVIAMVPNEPKAYFQRGLAYDKGNNTDAAVKDYTQAIAIAPNYLDAYLNRGGTYVDKLNKFDLGIADFNKVLELSPDNMDAITDIGIANYKKGDFKDAITWFNNAISKSSGNGRTLYLRALCYAGTQNYAKAIDDAKQAQKLGLSVDQALIKQWEAGAGK